MTKTLVIVESPSKAKKIGRFLGKDFIVQASIGHIVDLVSRSKNSLGVHVDRGFIPIYGIIPTQKNKVKALIKYASQVDQIYLAPDPDREGEAIAWHLYEIIRKKNDKPIKRVTFQEITKKAVLAGINSPRELDKNLFDAQQARRVLDRIVGFSVSPFLINKFNSPLSAGRVQSVTVKMIVDKEREINAFKPEEYWNINSPLSKNGENFTAKYIKKVNNTKTAQQVKSDLETDTYKVDKVDEFEQEREPLAPLITSSLASAAAGKYKFSAAQTMKAAQALYEAGLITYMRTDSTRLAKESTDFCRQWLEENKYDIPAKTNVYVSKKKAQDAHEAIRPTNVNQTPNNIYLPDEQTKIYVLIWERFVACQMNPALYDNVNVTIKTSSNHKLKASGKILKYKGWLEVIKDKSKDILLPSLKEEDKLKLSSKVSAIQKFTKPPARFSEKSLIEELEKKRIGRPSTYAAIMSKITSRAYVNKPRNKMFFIPTEKGMQVVDELDNFFEFMKYSYTAEMEDKLDLIAEGKLSYGDMMEEFYSPFKIELNKAYMSGQKDYGFRCSECEEEETIMYLHNGTFGYYLACVNYPKNCNNTLSCKMVGQEPVVTDNKGEPFDGAKCPNCQSPMLKYDGRFGPYTKCIEFPICKGKGKVPYGKKCPDCYNELYATFYENKNVLFCTGYYINECRYSEELSADELVNPEHVAVLKAKPVIPKKIDALLKR